MKLPGILNKPPCSGSVATFAHGTAGQHVTAYWHWGLFILLQAFNLYQLSHHAMWRDELQTWSMVRASGTLPELFHNMRYDGFPPLWYLCLWLLSFLTSSPLAMQLFHFACSSAAQCLVMTRAPFTGNMRLAIVAGYYLSFEYCIISRAYVLGVLLLFCFCAFHSWFSKHQPFKGMVLGLLANTSFFGAILSLAFVAGDLLEALKNRGTSEKTYGKNMAGAFSFLTVYGIFLLIAISFMLPPDDGNYAAGIILTPDLTENFNLLCRNLISLVPVPTPRITFWNSLAAFDAGTLVALPVSLAVLLAIWLVLRDTPRYLTVFITGFSVVWLFNVVKYNGTIRHVGSLMLLFIACTWCAGNLKELKKELLSKSSRLALWCILAANLVAWIVASYYHLKYDFSGSREMARIIQHSSDGSPPPIVADSDYATSSVAGYLGRPLHYVTSRKQGTFIQWNRERIGGGQLEAQSLAETMTVNGISVVWLLVNYPLESGNSRLLARSSPSIVEDEVFYLYEYAR